MSFQDDVFHWMIACFSGDVCKDIQERGDRFLEETLEYLQSHGYDRTRIPTLVDYTYNRPVGEPMQELGGVMVTLAAHAQAAGLNMDAVSATPAQDVSDAPKFHGDDGSPRIKALRAEFEDWYVVNALDYARDPIGSDVCDKQWRGWKAARELQQAQVVGGWYCPDCCKDCVPGEVTYAGTHTDCGTFVIDTPQSSAPVVGEIGAASPQSDFPECSGTPNDCPENEGHGCCNAASPGVGGGDGIEIPPGLNPDTRKLVINFACALAGKLAAAEQKYGYTDGWKSPDWMDECRAQLVAHVAKGDPRDVAAYAAFLWHHGESTATAAIEALAKREVCDPVAWDFQMRDTPDYPGDSMREVLWDTELAEAQRKRGYSLRPLYDHPAPTPAVEVADYEALYQDLIYQVGNKWPGESRHETAKRYILGAESNTGEAAMKSDEAALSASRQSVGG